jgi:aromatic-L-amino-acid decarboxylase
VFAEAQEAISRTFEYAGPGYLAYIPGGGLYTAALADFIRRAVNRYVGLVAAQSRRRADRGERHPVVVRSVRLPGGLQGLLLSGGSMANLSAMVTAPPRQARRGLHRRRSTT